jgi:integrase
MEARQARSDWLATALVGLYGLRPAELAALRVEENRLYVSPVKRNRRTMTARKPDRLVLPLDLPGREGEGAKALSLYSSGQVKLPLAIRNAAASGRLKEAGRAFREVLQRDPAWQSLVRSIPGLVPYSLRHGYAWRGVKGYERSIPVRDLAALMGHNPGTHHRHYGSWTAEADLMESVGAIAKG